MIKFVKFIVDNNTVVNWTRLKSEAWLMQR